MFCCFLPSRASRSDTHNDEKKAVLTSGPTTINYRTIVSIPYAHVIRDDNIQNNLSNVSEIKDTDTYLLFNSRIPDEGYETTCFSFDDVDVSNPVVFATKSPDGHILLERVIQIEHVTAINPSSTSRRHESNQTKTISSAPIPDARPYDEFVTDSGAPDGQGDSTITKSD